MLDKFVTLTLKILKVLGLEDVELNIFKPYNEVEVGIYRCINELNLYASTRLFVSDFQQLTQERAEIEVYVAYGHTTNIEDRPRLVVESYISIISKIFYKYISPQINIMTLHINNSAEYIVDELLGYTEEELKLYISLL